MSPIAGGSLTGILTGVSLALLAVTIILCSRRCRRSNNKTVEELEIDQERIMTNDLTVKIDSVLLSETKIFITSSDSGSDQ